MAITVGRRFDYDDVHFKYFVDLLERNIKDKVFNGILNFAPFLQYLPGDLFGGKRIQKAIDEILAFLNEEIEEHERTLDENNARDFIDVYLTEMKQNKTKENVFTGILNIKFHFKVFHSLLYTMDMFFIIEGLWITCRCL